MLEDPVCGLCLHPDDTAGQSMYEQDLFYFCSIKCKKEFEKYPDKYKQKQKNSSRLIRIHITLIEYNFNTIYQYLRALSYHI